MKLTRLILLGLCLFVLAACNTSKQTLPDQTSPGTEPADPAPEDPTPEDPAPEDPTPPAPPSQPSGPIPETLELIEFVSGLTEPLFISAVPETTNTFYVVEKTGRIKVMNNAQVSPQAVLDISSLISSGKEQGLLGLAIHPDFQRNGFIYVNYTDKAPNRQNTQIVRYTVTNNVANLATTKPILSFPQPRSNHNGGMLLFGPDGYLYIGTGDGGVPDDADGYAQSINSYLGKILRIDINSGDPYAIPTNAFAAAPGVKTEIWSYGLRNPWRFSFDRATGDMWIGDVGEEESDEISFQPVGLPGNNYGWPCKEASATYAANTNATFCSGRTFVDPVLEYSQPGGMSVTGGYVYRGKAIPELQGRYIYGDFLSGKIWFLTQDKGDWIRSEWQDTDLNISSFGEDSNGELFVIDFSGTIYKLVNSQ
jgi:glucose/arabinose dehydrogenase